VFSRQRLSLPKASEACQENAESICIIDAANWPELAEFFKVFATRSSGKL
jgi:hypothetical protein